MAYSAAFDQDYELDQLESGTGLDWIFGYDPVGNILAIDDQVSTLNDQSFGYDDLYRLETAEGDYPDELFEYDQIMDTHTSLALTPSTGRPGDVQQIPRKDHGHPHLFERKCSFP